MSAHDQAVEAAGPRGGVLRGMVVTRTRAAAIESFGRDFFEDEDVRLVADFTTRLLMLRLEGVMLTTHTEHQSQEQVPDGARAAVRLWVGLHLPYPRPSRPLLWRLTSPVRWLRKRLTERVRWRIIPTVSNHYHACPHLPLADHHVALHGETRASQFHLAWLQHGHDGTEPAPPAAQPCDRCRQDVPADMPAVRQWSAKLGSYRVHHMGQCPPPASGWMPSTDG